MFKRFMLSGALVVGLVALGGQEARAGGFAGWAWSCCSELEGSIDLRGVRNFVKFPTFVLGEATLNTVEILCINPADNAASGLQTGNSYDQEITDSEGLNSDTITGKGTANITLRYPLDEFQSPEFCPNPNWSDIPDTAWVLAFSVVLTWQTDAFEVLDTVTLFCEVPPGTERVDIPNDDPDLGLVLAPSGVEYECVEIE
jgi:hypothetical protein